MHACNIARHTHRIKGNDGWRGEPAVCVRQDPRQTVLDDRDGDVGRPQVDANDCAQACKSMPAPSLCGLLLMEYLSSTEAHARACHPSRADMHCGTPVHVVTCRQFLRLQVPVHTPAAMARRCCGAATRCIKRTSAGNACNYTGTTCWAVAGDLPLLMAPSLKGLDGGVNSWHTTRETCGKPHKSSAAAEYSQLHRICCPCQRTSSMAREGRGRGRGGSATTTRGGGVAKTGGRGPRRGDAAPTARGGGRGGGRAARCGAGRSSHRRLRRQI